LSFEFLTALPASRRSSLDVLPRSAPPDDIWAHARCSRVGPSYQNRQGRHVLWRARSAADRLIAVMVEELRVDRRCLAPDVTMPSNRRRPRGELRPHPKEEAMSHALATVLHRGRKAASNVTSACLASSRGARPENDASKRGVPAGSVGGGSEIRNCCWAFGRKFLIPHSSFRISL